MAFRAEHSKNGNSKIKVAKTTWIWFLSGKSHHVHGNVSVTSISQSPCSTELRQLAKSSPCSSPVRRLRFFRGPQMGRVWSGLGSGLCRGPSVTRRDLSAGFSPKREVLKLLQEASVEEVFPENPTWKTFPNLSALGGFIICWETGLC